MELVETDRESGDALDGFHSVTLWERDPGPTARLLTDIFGYEQVGHEARMAWNGSALRRPVTRGVRSWT